MLIECHHCGAPLDVKEGQRMAKCRYCDTMSEVRSMRTVAFETPPAWKPPREWRPPENFAADSARVLVYHAASAVRWVVGMAVTVVFIGIGIAALLLLAQPTASVGSALFERAAEDPTVRKSVREAMAGVGEALGKAKAQIEQGRAAGADGERDLLTSTGIDRVIRAYKEKIGAQSIAVVRLVVHDTHSSAEIQDPKNPKHVDSYHYRAGSVTGPEPVRLMGAQKNDLTPFLFDPDKVALGRLDELGAAALSALAYEGATLSHVIVDRDRGQTAIRVYASSPRDSGYVRFDDKGKLVRAYK